MVLIFGDRRSTEGFEVTDLGELSTERRELCRGDAELVSDFETPRLNLGILGVASDPLLLGVTLDALALGVPADALALGVPVDALALRVSVDALLIGVSDNLFNLP